MESKSISQIAEVIAGQSPPSDSYNEKGEGLPFYQGKTDFGEIHPNPRKWCTNPKKIAEVNDILMSVRAPVGPVNVTNEKACIGRGLGAIRPKGKNDFRYVYYFLKNNQELISRYSTGSTFKSISKRDIEKIKINVPKDPLDQKRIAQVLTDCEELIAKRKESIALLDELLKSTFLEMFGDPVKNENNFELVPLHQLGTIDRGVSKFRPRNAPELLGGNHPLIQTGDISNAGTYITQYKHTYSDLGLSQSKKWPIGTLCITIAANIAKTGILTFEACFPDSVVGFIVNEKSNNLYVHFLFSFFQRILEKNAPSAAQKNINLGILRNLKVPKPPIKLQNEFAEIVQKVEETKKLYQKHLDELENLYGRLSQDAFKGKLNLSKVILREEFLDKDDNNNENETPSAWIEYEEEKKKKLTKKEVKEFHSNIKRKKRKKDITDVSLADFLRVPEDIQSSRQKIDFELIFDDLFFQFTLKDTFKKGQSFTFEELEKRLHNYFYYQGDMDFPYEGFKDAVFNFISSQPPLIEQFFDENDAQIKLKLTNEAYKA